MTNDVPIEVREYLKRCGLSERTIARCNGSTRMYHDLGLYGDIAEAYLGVLANSYHVDMSGFEFEKFFPLEFAGRNKLSRALLWIVPFAGMVARRRGEYFPLTLDMIARTIRAKWWFNADGLE
jgi:hypothetical protein